MKDNQKSIRGLIEKYKGYHEDLTKQKVNPRLHQVLNEQLEMNMIQELHKQIDYPYNLELAARNNAHYIKTYRDELLKQGFSKRDVKELLILAVEG